MSSMRMNIPATFDNINTSLNDSEVKYLYKMLFYLSNIEKTGESKGFDVRDKKLNQFLKSECIKLDYKNTPIKHFEKNTIIFKKGDSACFYLLKHIRNAFAHGRLTKIKNQYEIVDFYKGKMTAYGLFSPSKLFNLVDKIIEYRKR